MPRPPELIRSLGYGDAALLTIGCIVGVGIFRSASSIAAQLPSPSAILALWVVGGLVSLCGALCYAELAAMFPASGGDYIYISAVYGRFAGFLFGWTKLFIERTGTIAILGMVFAEYGSRVIPYGPDTLRWVAAGAILLLTAVNVAGVQWGKYVQNVFTVLKIGALAAIIIAGCSAAAGQNTVNPSWALPPVNLSLLQSMGVAFVFVLWTYGGWTEAAYLAEEIREPTRTVPLAIISGLLAVTGLYLLVNLSYLLFIPVATLPETPLVASAVMQDVLGTTGAVFIAWMVACSAFGALNGYILTGGRILYAIGKDHRLFASLGAVHPTFHTPATALAANALLAIALVWTKTFDQIATYSTVVISVFFMMAVWGVVLLRRRAPRQPRPYRAWGYPWTPALFLLTMAGFMINMAVKDPAETLFGFGLLAAGVPLSWWSRRLDHAIAR